MEHWPNFFIVGAPRAGTSSLWEYLKAHDEIFMSTPKEPNFFHNVLLKNKIQYPISNKKKYLNLFKNVKNEKVIGEASTTYLHDPDSAQLIHAVVPKARIIIILRNPINRAFSHYSFHVKLGVQKMPFAKVIRKDASCINEKFSTPPNIIRAGLYSEFVQRYLDFFYTTNVKIIIFEEFINNAKKTVKEVLQFLGVNTEYKFVEGKYNTSEQPKGKLAQLIISNSLIEKLGPLLIPSPFRIKLLRKFLYKKDDNLKMNHEDKAFLENFYNGDILKTQKLLGMTLPW